MQTGKEFVVNVVQVFDDAYLVSIAPTIEVSARRPKKRTTDVNREIISLLSMVPKIVFSAILNPLACKIGRTAPDSAGSIYL